MTSCTIRIGSRIAAAWSGGTVSAISGVAAMPMPAKPPLARPRNVTATTATRMNKGSVITDCWRAGVTAVHGAQARPRGVEQDRYLCMSGGLDRGQARSHGCMARLHCRRAGSKCKVRFERECAMDAPVKSRYHEIYARAQRDPAGFWAEAATEIDWIEPARKLFDPAAGVYGRWFVGGVCNTCFNAVDRHVAGGRAGQTAIIYDSPVTNTKRKFSYAELLAEVKTLAAMLTDLGVRKGDRVVIYMPMVPEAMFAMLACARIGAVHSVVFGGFAAKELATRIDDCKPKVILSASCGLEPGRVVQYKPLLDEAITLAAHKPQSCLILQRAQAQGSLIEGRDRDWAQMRDHALIHACSAFDCAAVEATGLLYVVYTAGTTGRAKGVVRDNGGH